MLYSKPSVYYLISFLANIYVYAKYLAKIFKEEKNTVFFINFHFPTGLKLPILLDVHNKYTSISSLKRRMTLGPVFTRILYVFTSLLLLLYRERVQKRNKNAVHRQSNSCSVLLEVSLWD